MFSATLSFKSLIWLLASCSLLVISSIPHFWYCIPRFWLVLLNCFHAWGSLRDLRSVLYTVSGRPLASVSLGSFWGGFPCFFWFETHFFISPFWLPLCIWVLSRSAMFPNLGMMASYSRCVVELRVSFSLFTWARCSRNIPFVWYVNPPVLIEILLLLAHEDQLQP